MLNNLLKVIPRMWKAQDLNPGNVASEFVLLTAMLYFIFARVSTRRNEAPGLSSERPPTFSAQ